MLKILLKTTTTLSFAEFLISMIMNLKKWNIKNIISSIKSKKLLKVSNTETSRNYIYN